MIAQKQVLIDRFNELLGLTKPIAMTPLADRLPIIGTVSGKDRLRFERFKLS